MSGKGSSPRPYSVDRKTFENNWDNIFRKDKRVEEDQQNEDKKVKIIWGYSSVGRAPVLQAGGHRFDPVYLHQYKGEICKLE
jgi:hypothetical protein